MSWNPRLQQWTQVPCLLFPLCCQRESLFFFFLTKPRQEPFLLGILRDVDVELRRCLGKAGTPGPEAQEFYLLPEAVGPLGGLPGSPRLVAGLRPGSPHTTPSAAGGSQAGGIGCLLI